MVRRLRVQRQALGLVMEDLYGYLSITRQGYAQRLKSRQAEVTLMKLVKNQVLDYRKDKDRRAGSRSLYYNLDIKGQFGFGVTKFEQLMSQYGLTLLPLRVRVVTTQSVCQSWNYDNLLNGLTINGINQVVVGDLTYVYIGRSLFYLFCLTDVYSARLVGLWGSERMRAEDAKQAFSQWVLLRGKEHLKGCIHHTDGGSQYFSGLYLKQLNDHDLPISVAQNCLQNGFAEQRNGLIKHHLIPCKQIQELQTFQQQLLEIDYFYNYERKQKELNWRTPVEYEQYITGLEPDKRPVKALHDFG
ncbi:MAG: DDE-type integrase/transposase/recombinase [Haliscomenobacter sp.]|nr:DDE-type integrase/transposase/recombinase [Haliscomenobacter sp.]